MLCQVPVVCVTLGGCALAAAPFCPGEGLGVFSLSRMCAVGVCHSFLCSLSVAFDTELHSVLNFQYRNLTQPWSAAAESQPFHLTEVIWLSYSQ